MGTDGTETKDIFRNSMWLNPIAIFCMYLGSDFSKYLTVVPLSRATCADLGATCLGLTSLLMPVRYLFLSVCQGVSVPKVTRSCVEAQVSSHFLCANISQVHPV